MTVADRFALADRPDDEPFANFFAPAPGPSDARVDLSLSLDLDLVDANAFDDRRWRSPTTRSANDVSRIDYEKLCRADCRTNSSMHPLSSIFLVDVYGIFAARLVTDRRVPTPACITSLGAASMSFLARSDVAALAVFMTKNRISCASIVLR